MNTEQQWAILAGAQLHVFIHYFHLLVSLGKDGNPGRSCLLWYSILGIRGLGKVSSLIKKKLNLLSANICRQWFRLFIQVFSTTAVSLQGAVPHGQLHHLHYCQFKYLFTVLGHQWGQNDWKSSKISQQNTLYPSTMEPSRKLFYLGKAIRGSICISLLIIWSDSKYKTYLNYVLFSAIWGL